MSPKINAPVACSAWPKAVAPQFPEPAPVKVKDCFEGVSPSSDENVKAILEKACKALVEAKAELDRLDSKVGDADCGSTMAKAASSILEKQEQLPMADPKAFCACLSDLLGKTMGGSSGVLLSIMFMGMSSHLDGSNSWSSGPAALKAGLQAMMDAGGAAPGARTMLDALVPAADALVEQKGLTGAAAAAKEGTEKTKSMKPKAGRSENVPESVLKGVPDPGAKAVELVFEWREFLDEILKAAPKQRLPWPELQQRALQKLTRSEGGGARGKRRKVALEVLAHLPAAYVNPRDPFVRLPQTPQTPTPRGDSLRVICCGDLHALRHEIQALGIQTMSPGMAKGKS
ncbi:unnamed protein product [Cladocopium goreaui]|uniref:Dihydroxyacetone kinase (DHA kinase) (Glyceron e kinase) n=1 Tax=Cladocopium goreaui TaxID=2562237 RepID=A0A9P1D1W7_9DINO|nr:unnamed protein product [Cladocopium goreaui]